MLPRKQNLMLLTISIFNYFIVFKTSAEKVPSETKIILYKCCPSNQVVSGNCTDYNSDLPKFNTTIYDRFVHDKATHKRLEDVYRIEPLKDGEEFMLSSTVWEDINVRTYLCEDGILYQHDPNAYNRWISYDNLHFCADYRNDPNKSTLELTFWALSEDVPLESSTFHSIALLVSSFFLFLVLLVYTLIPALRNLYGKVLMAYVLSQFFAFIFLAIIQLGSPGSDECIKLTACIYFFFLASFSWMNVMSYDIWWTFRGYAKARPINRRGETFKFLMYCIYAWGVPMVMTIAMVEINKADLSHMPWFVQPLIPSHGCFLEAGQKLVYLYAPMLILIISNWLFYLMTAFNIWRLNRSTAVLDSAAAGTPAAHRSQRQRFLLYLKLSIVMGVNWVLEVVSALSPELVIWNFTDAYNLLIGVSIFLIFVCKKKIYLQLRARFTKDHSGRVLPKCNTSSSTLSNSSQDVTLQVLSHPNGSANNKQNNFQYKANNGTQ